MSVANLADDRLAIRELLDAYAHHADRKQAAAQAALFTNDAVIEVFMGEPVEGSTPVQVLHGRTAIEAAFAAALRPYDLTTHFNGQSTVRIDGDEASNDSHTLAHHFWQENGQRMLLVMGIRYRDRLVRQQGSWLFEQRTLLIDWTDRRPSSP